MAEVPVAKNKRPDLVVLFAVWHFLVAALLVFLLLVVGAFLVIAVFEASPSDILPALLVLGFAAGIIAVFLAANVAAGWGLLALQNWARWLAIILGVLSLPNFPTGTIIGLAQVWFLTTPEAKEAFGVAE